MYFRCSTARSGRSLKDHGTIQEVEENEILTSSQQTLVSQATTHVLSPGGDNNNQVILSDSLLEAIAKSLNNKVTTSEIACQTDDGEYQSSGVHSTFTLTSDKCDNTHNSKCDSSGSSQALLHNCRHNGNI